METKISCMHVVSFRVMWTWISAFLLLLVYPLRRPPKHCRWYGNYIGVQAVITALIIRGWGWCINQKFKKTWGWCIEV